MAELGLLELAAGFVELLLVEVAVDVGLVASDGSAAGAVIGTITNKVESNRPKAESAATSLLLSTLLATLTPLYKISSHLKDSQT